MPQWAARWHSGLAPVTTGDAAVDARLNGALQQSPKLRARLAALACGWVTRQLMALPRVRRLAQEMRALIVEAARARERARAFTPDEKADGLAARTARAALGEASRAHGEQLLRACEEERAEDALRLLREGADPDCANDSGLTSLMLACTLASLGGLVAPLVAAGAALDRIDRRSWSALICACFYGHEAAAILLVKAGAALDLVRDHGETALDLAVAKGLSGAAAAIRERGGCTGEGMRVQAQKRADAEGVKPEAAKNKAEAEVNADTTTKADAKVVAKAKAAVRAAEKSAARAVRKAAATSFGGNGGGTDGDVALYETLASRHLSRLRSNLRHTLGINCAVPLLAPMVLTAHGAAASWEPPRPPFAGRLELAAALVRRGRGLWRAAERAAAAAAVAAAAASTVDGAALNGAGAR